MFLISFIRESGIPWTFCKIKEQTTVETLIPQQWIDLYERSNLKLSKSLTSSAHYFPKLDRNKNSVAMKTAIYMYILYQKIRRGKNVDNTSEDVKFWSFFHLRVWNFIFKKVKSFLTTFDAPVVILRKSQKLIFTLTHFILF